MNDQAKLNQLGSLYKKFRALNPRRTAVLPREVREIALELSAAGVRPSQIAAACAVSEITARSWCKPKIAKRRGRPRLDAQLTPPPATAQVAVRRVNASTLGLAALANAEASSDALAGEISVVINGVAVAGKAADLRQLLGFLDA